MSTEQNGTRGGLAERYVSERMAECRAEVERLTAECERLRKEAMDWSGVAGKNLAHAEYADAALIQARERIAELEDRLNPKAHDVEEFYQEEGPE